MKRILKLLRKEISLNYLKINLVLKEIHIKTNNKKVLRIKEFQMYLVYHATQQLKRNKI